MAKNTNAKISSASTVKSTVAKDPIINTAAFAFGRENYVLLGISAIVLIIGYMLMAGGKPTDPSIFNEEVFSFRRITLAPIVVIIGYVIGVYAIVKKAD